MDWYNEPPQWSVQERTIVVQAGATTDFWRLTHDGGLRDSGHFYFQRHTGDFQATVKVVGQYIALYDQAGLMIRIDEANWLKCGIEFVDGIQHISAVVTREYSDWSLIRPEQNPAALWLKLDRKGATVEVSYSLDGQTYHLFRQAYLSQVETVDVGVMCASPVGGGFAVTFEDFALQG
jgi:regulation of enolase protein 1 (concanavalin A-like superfamily)